MNVSDDGYMKAVTDLYERVIEETQSNYDVLHRPEILKSTNMGYQTIGMFQTDNLQQTGILYGALGDLQVKQKAYKKDKSAVNQQKLKDAQKRMGKAIRSRIYSSLWLAAITILGDVLLRKFKPYIDDEDKDITSKSVLERMMLLMAEDVWGVSVPVVGQLVTKGMDTFGEGYDFLNDPAFDVLEDFIKATSKIWKAYSDEDGDVVKAWLDAIPSISNITGIPAKNISDMFNGIKGYAGDVKVGDFAHDITDYASGNKSFYSYGDLASYIVSGDQEKETKVRDYYSASGKEIAKSTLTEEIKPAYVQMYVDSPEKAYAIKSKLIVDYDYDEDSISKWTINGWLDNIVDDFEYATEIKSAAKNNGEWKSADVKSTAKSYYKKVFKKGDSEDIQTLKEALIKDGEIPSTLITSWENEANKEIKKEADEKEKEKAKYR
jgi:hypothetical protein